MKIRSIFDKQLLKKVAPHSFNHIILGVSRMESELFELMKFFVCLKF